MADNCYVVKGGKQQWLARLDIAQLGEHEIKQLTVSASGTKLANLSSYHGKARHGLPEVLNVNFEGVLPRHGPTPYKITSLTRKSSM